MSQLRIIEKTLDCSSNGPSRQLPMPPSEQSGISPLALDWFVRADFLLEFPESRLGYDFLTCLWVHGDIAVSHPEQILIEFIRVKVMVVIVGECHREHFFLLKLVAFLTYNHPAVCMHMAHVRFSLKRNFM